MQNAPGSKKHLPSVVRKGIPEMKQMGWYSDNKTGGRDGKAER
jgi:hypothetical protein